MHDHLMCRRPAEAAHGSRSLPAEQSSADGRFCPGPLQDRTVNIRWYLKREGWPDTTESPALNLQLPITPHQAARLRLFIS
jgi:hypothetical protein